MRTSNHDQKGRFSCDRCGKDSPRGVYTGVKGFIHVCPSCKSLLEGVKTAIGDDVLGTKSLPAQKDPSVRKSMPLATLAALKAKRAEGRATA